MNQKIKFQDLGRLHGTIRAELNEAFDQVLTHSSFIQGAPVQKFEKDFSEFTQSKHCLGVANGTDALELALEALGIQSGDSVIVPSMTFAATAEAVVRQKGQPVFAEIDASTACVTAKTLREAYEQAKCSVKAVILVHLYGRACEMGSILEFCREKNLRVIEDCAQAHGASFQGRHVGTWGDIGTFSFYPGKNLGALGDAGALVTQSDEYFQKLKLLRDHGRTDKYSHSIAGRNSRLDALQAAFLSIKLRHLPDWTARRQDLARLYSESLSGISGVQTLALPHDRSGHVYHLYVIRVTSSQHNRDDLARHLASEGIEALIHYPIPLHQQAAFSAFTSKQSLAFTEKFSKEILSLPMDPLMTPEEVVRVSQTVRRFFV
jgi:dTDP-4-amino-4,6-dideoxygalactose transaminase